MSVRTPFQSVAFYVPAPVATFSLGIVNEIFGFDRQGRGLPGFRVRQCAHQPGLVPTDTGLSVLIEHDLSALAEADVVVVLPGHPVDQPVPDPVAEGLRAAYHRGALLVSLCTGIFVLAGTGLLDGKRATTHWRWAAEFEQRYPRVRVVPEVLYVDEGQILTGAGAAAGVDICLHLLRREHGARVATAIARDIVMPAHRDGGQSQYVASPVPADLGNDRIGEVLDWALTHLDQPLTVTELAGRALMSPRSFARHFKAATGTTPHAWLLTQRLHRAEELLESAVELPIEEIARRVGFGTAAALREQFVRRRGVPPRAYRRAFAPPGPPEPAVPGFPEPAASDASPAAATAVAG